jgi:hypothetical protein
MLLATSKTGIQCTAGTSSATREWPGGLVQEPALGAHLSTARVGYTHHGIYVGGGKVVHYSGLCRSWHSGPVEEVALDGFALGHRVAIVDHVESTYSTEEIVGRARSRVGEHDYHLLTNNCEHFCNWCVSGLHRSAQIERPLALRDLALSGMSGLVSRLRGMGVRAPVPSAV